MARKRQVEGHVSEVLCSACGDAWAHFVFAGDTDSATEGLVCLVEVPGETVIIAQANAREWRDLARHQPNRLIDRVSQETGLEVFCPWLKRVTRNRPSAKGMRFLEFLKRAGPPTLHYTCHCGEDGDATEVDRHTPESFLSQGGALIFLDNTELRD